jgi:hypothetical protein
MIPHALENLGIGSMLLSNKYRGRNASKENEAELRILVFKTKNKVSLCAHAYSQ